MFKPPQCNIFITILFAYGVLAICVNNSVFPISLLNFQNHKANFNRVNVVKYLFFV